MLQKYSALLFVLLSLAIAGKGQAVHEYFFDGNLKERKGGPILTESKACGATNGAFSIEAITTTAGPCIVDTSFCFTDGGGVVYKNQNYITNNYTINVFFKFSALVGNWSRIIDFSNSTKDEGIYWNKNCLNFYPNGNVGSCPYFSAGTFYLISFVRESATGIISIYVDGVLFGTYNDNSTNIYRAPTGTTPIVFFRDDSVVTCETQPGCVKYISVSNIALPAAQIVNTWKNICAMIIPVEMKDLEVQQCAAASACLRWSTASEKNSAYFSVERSCNAYDFKEVGRVDAAGYSKSLRNYSFTDTIAAVKGTYYYRIKQFDHNDNSTATKIVSLVISGIKEELALHPQPILESAELVYTASENCSGRLVLFDMSGRELMERKDILMYAGLNTLPIDVEQLEKGLYVFHFLSSTGFSKFIRVEKK